MISFDFQRYRIKSGMTVYISNKCSHPELDSESHETEKDPGVKLSDGGLFQGLNGRLNNPELL